MDFGIRNCTEGREEIEVAPFVGLSDMLCINRAVAARIAWCRWRPRRGSACAPLRGASGCQILAGNEQMNAARRHVDLDFVASMHESERAADETFRRDV